MLVEELRIEGDRYECPSDDCDKTPRKVGGLQSHHVSMHGGKIPNTRCSQCGAEFHARNPGSRKYCHSDECGPESYRRANAGDFPYPPDYERYEMSIKMNIDLMRYAFEVYHNPLRGSHLKRQVYMKKSGRAIEGSRTALRQTLSDLIRCSEYLTEETENGTYEIDIEKLDERADRLGVELDRNVEQASV